MLECSFVCQHSPDGKLLTPERNIHHGVAQQRMVAEKQRNGLWKQRGQRVCQPNYGRLQKGQPHLVSREEEDSNTANAQVFPPSEHHFVEQNHFKPRQDVVKPE